MEVHEYQEGTADTAIYGTATYGLVKYEPVGIVDMALRLNYVTLGIAGEAGEIAEHIKKAIRDDGGTITPNRVLALEKEIGDICWYVSQLCSELGLDLEIILANNLSKLKSRKERGVLKGSGDDR